MQEGACVADLIKVELEGVSSSLLLYNLGYTQLAVPVGTQQRGNVVDLFSDTAPFTCSMRKLYFKPNLALIALGIEFLCTKIEMVLALTYSSER